jgi:hypothetical protein
MADSGLGKAPSLAAILSYPARPGDHSLGAAPPAVHVPHRASPCRLPPGAPLPAELFPAPPPRPIRPRVTGSWQRPAPPSHGPSHRRCTPPPPLTTRARRPAPPHARRPPELLGQSPSSPGPRAPWVSPPRTATTGTCALPPAFCRPARDAEVERAFLDERGEGKDVISRARSSVDGGG